MPVAVAAAAELGGVTTLTSDPGRRTTDPASLIRLLLTELVVLPRRTPPTLLPPPDDNTLVFNRAEPPAPPPLLPPPPPPPPLALNAPRLPTPAAPLSTTPRGPPAALTPIEKCGASLSWDGPSTPAACIGGVRKSARGAACFTPSLAMSGTKPKRYTRASSTSRINRGKPAWGTYGGPEQAPRHPRTSAREVVSTCVRAAQGGGRGGRHAYETQDRVH
jgi:hypothetical protein